MEGEMMKGGSCKCGHHKVVPASIILFGLMFLLERFGYVSMATVGIVWPILVIVAGLMKWNKSSCKCCPGGACKCN